MLKLSYYMLCLDYPMAYLIGHDYPLERNYAFLRSTEWELWVLKTLPNFPITLNF